MGGTISSCVSLKVENPPQLWSEGDREMWRQKDWRGSCAGFEDWDGGAQLPGVQTASRSRKGKETDSPLEPPERTGPAALCCQPREICGVFGSPQSWKSTAHVLRVTTFTVTCGSNRKPPTYTPPAKTASLFSGRIRHLSPVSQDCTTFPSPASLSPISSFSPSFFLS